MTVTPEHPDEAGVLDGLPRTSLPVTHLMDAEIRFRETQIFGTPVTTRMVAVVQDGTFTGPRLRGEILPGGGGGDDWLVMGEDRICRLDIRATLLGAVAAQGGADPTAVVAAALRGEAAAEPAGAGEEILLTNNIGLHARPAALLARAVSELDAHVTVSFGDKRVDARSVLGLMALGARGGDTIHVSAGGAQAAEALTRVRDLAARKFDE